MKWIFVAIALTYITVPISAFADEESLYEANLNRASQKSDRGFHVDAFEALSKEILDYPKKKEGYYYRGLVLQRMGLYMEAIEDYDRALEIDPRYAKAEENRDLSARALRQETVRRNQENADAQALQGRVAAISQLDIILHNGMRTINLENCLKYLSHAECAKEERMWLEKRLELERSHATYPRYIPGEGDL